MLIAVEQDILNMVLSVLIISLVVTLNGDVSDEMLKKTIEDQDYKVLGIE